MHLTSKCIGSIFRCTPLPNVSIQIKGSNVGTVTGPDGSFSLSAPSSARTLVFSSVGRTQQEVAIGNNTTLSVSLQAAERSLDEVVVVGYVRSAAAMLLHLLHGLATTK